MKKGILEHNKNYYICDEKNNVLSEITSKSALINIWGWDKMNGDNSAEGTKIVLLAPVPRMAGSDFFVDHGGEIVEKIVNIPYGKKIEIITGFWYDPQTCEYTMEDYLKFKE